MSRDMFAAIVHRLTTEHEKTPERAIRAVTRWAAGITDPYEVYRLPPYLRARELRRNRELWLPPRRG